MIRRWREANVYCIELDDSADIDTFNEPRSHATNDHLSKNEWPTRFGDTWHGASLKGAREMLRDGWREGLELVNNLAEKFRSTLPAPKSFRRRGQWCEDGDEPSWEREQAGHTTIWRASKRQTTVGPATVHLLCPWVHSSGCSAEQIKWNGVVLAVLCDLLENAGYRVGATLTNCLRMNDGSFFLGLMHVKQPSQPLDLATLVPVVAHPAAYRRFGIDWATLCDKYCGDGFGSVLSLGSIPNIPSKPKDGVVLNTVYSEAAAKQEIQRVLAMFNSGNPMHAMHGSSF